MKKDPNGRYENAVISFGGATEQYYGVIDQVSETYMNISPYVETTSHTGKVQFTHILLPRDAEHFMVVTATEKLSQYMKWIDGLFDRIEDLRQELGVDFSQHSTGVMPLKWEWEDWAKKKVLLDACKLLGTDHKGDDL